MRQACSFSPRAMGLGAVLLFCLSLTFHSPRTVFCKGLSEGLAAARVKKAAWVKRSQKLVAPDNVLHQLERGDFELPFTFCLRRSADDASRNVTIRCMEATDLPTIQRMCKQEFMAPMPKTSRNPGRLDWTAGAAQWWEETISNALLGWSLQAKLHQTTHNKRVSIREPLTLVLCTQAKVVAMAELSLQPVIPLWNPPAIPLPYAVKEWVSARFTTERSLQGWITNVLVDPQHRGNGYSKYLMLAAEGWAATRFPPSVKAIYLHADADGVSGKIPQRLYEGLGYVAQDAPSNPGNSKEEDDYLWLRSTDGSLWEPDEGLKQNKIHMIQGAALLFYKKNIRR